MGLNGSTISTDLLRLVNALAHLCGYEANWKTWAEVFAAFQLAFQDASVHAYNWGQEGMKELKEYWNQCWPQVTEALSAALDETRQHFVRMAQQAAETILRYFNEFIAWIASFDLTSLVSFNANK